MIPASRLAILLWIVAASPGAAVGLGGYRKDSMTLVGTLGYVPPERLGGTEDVRGDLYALGASLLHLLTRKPPESMLRPGLSLDLGDFHENC